MRLKQLLGILILLLMLSTMAAAAGVQLTNVAVAPQGNGTLVTLRTTGTFTHNEYRPADNLLLVDLTGVSAARMSGQSRSLAVPGVVSYRILGYKGASGAEVTRMELTLSPSAVITVHQESDALMVQVTGAAAPQPVVKSVTPAAAATPAPVKAAAPARTEPAPAGPTATVRDVQVVRSNGALNIEIAANAPLTPKVMKLTAPDRLVIDLPNALPASKQNIAVNSADVKSVRMARFQDNPPTTRVVVDLATAREFDIQPNGNMLVLKMKSPVVSAPAPQTVPEAVVAKSTPAAVAAEPQKPAVRAAEPVATPPVETAKAEPAADPNTAPPVVFVEPTFKAKSGETEQADNSLPKHVDPPARVVEAAAKMAASTTMQSPMTPSPAASIGPAVNLAQQQAMQAAAAPTATRPKYTGEPISVNLKDVDLKDFFRLIHEISGLNIVLDPNVKGSLTLVLDDVPWDQALDIVLQNNGLDKQLEGNVLRIATVDTIRHEAESRRAQIEAQALAVDKVTVTRFLSYAHSKDVLPTIKKFLSQRGDVVADDRTNGLIISDIPSVIPNLDRLINQLDRKTQEVEIEARVVAATRNFARDIGTQLGVAWGGASTAIGGASAVGTSPVTVNGTTLPPFIITQGSSAQSQQIPLFTNFPAVGPTTGITLLNRGAAYRVDAVLTLAESRGLLKIISRPRVVTQNNIQALVRQGIRIPVVTAAQLGGPPTVTYVDAFLRLTVTPQITVENTIFLNLDVENTTPDFSQTIGGNPTLITQQATTQVLVTDGGTVVIGGVIQTNNAVNVFQTPLLGNLPILGNLFKRRSVTTQTQELIFFITPKIIQT